MAHSVNSHKQTSTDSVPLCFYYGSLISQTSCANCEPVLVFSTSKMRLVSRFRFAAVLTETKLLASCCPIADYLAIRQLWGFIRQSELGHVFV